MVITLTSIDTNAKTNSHTQMSIDPDVIIAYRDYYIGLRNGTEVAVSETRNEIELAIKESRIF